MELELNNLIVERDNQIRNMRHFELVMSMLESRINRLGETSIRSQQYIQALNYFGQIYDDMYLDLQEIERRINFIHD